MRWYELLFAIAFTITLMTACSSENEGLADARVLTEPETPTSIGVGDGTSEPPENDADATTSDPPMLLGHGVPQTWDGTFVAGPGGEYPRTPMSLRIETVDGPVFTGLLRWAELGNSVTTIDGELVDDFSDFVELSKWEQVPAFDNTDSRTCIKFFEGAEIQGNEINDGGWYYACLTGSGALGGVWFRDEATAESWGEFVIEVS